VEDFKSASRALCNHHRKIVSDKEKENHMTFKELSAGQCAPAIDTTGAKAKPAPVKDASPTDTAPTNMPPTKS
jgi:hypothetical protein